MEYKQRRDRRGNTRKLRNYEKVTESAGRLENWSKGSRENDDDKRQLEVVFLKIRLWRG